MENVLSVSKLSKRYGDQYAVKDLSFDIPRGSVYGILGPNGSGKTTTLGMIVGVVRIHQGSIRWFGSNFSHHLLKKVGAILEKPNFYPYMNAIQNLKIVAKIKEVSKEEINLQIQDNLELVGLALESEKKFKDYSLGMKQRLAIASAMMNQPEFLIFDEPTNGLDVQGVIEIRNLIKRISKRGITVILASHILDEVQKVCSHVLILKKGEKIYDGKLDENTNLEELFLEVVNK